MSTLATTIGRGVTGSRPAASEAGRLYFDTTVSILYRDNGSSWDSISASALTNPMTTAEDIIVGGASGTPARKAVGAAGAALSVINGALAYNSGTANPGSALAGDRYWRTDLGLEIYYDGTRWLTTQMFEAVFTLQNQLTFTGSPNQSKNITSTRYPPLHSVDLWLVDFRWIYQVGATHDASNYWTCPLDKYDNTTDASIVTLTTDKSTTTWNNPAPTAIGALLGTANTLLFAGFTMVGTTGTFGASAVLRYRRVVT